MRPVFRPFDRLSAVDERDVEVERGFALRLAAEVPTNFFDRPRSDLDRRRRRIAFRLQLAGARQASVVHRKLKKWSQILLML